jgi:hypothetical protein
MRSLKWIVFVLVFFMEVRIRAEETKLDHRPASCWGHKIPCAEQATSSRRILTLRKVTLVLAAGTIVEHRNRTDDTDTLQLVRGHFYVEAGSGIALQTPFGKFHCDKSGDDDCKGLIWREDTSVNLRSLGGAWRITRMGDSAEYALAPGLQTVLSEVNETGKAGFEFPQSLPWAQTLKEWAALYPREWKAFKAEVASFRPVWTEAVESVSQLHKSIVKREVAAYYDGIAAQKARAAREAAEDESLRSMFRQKNYMNP